MPFTSLGDQGCQFFQLVPKVLSSKKPPPSQLFPIFIFLPFVFPAFFRAILQVVLISLAILALLYLPVVPGQHVRTTQSLWKTLPDKTPENCSTDNPPTGDSPH